MINRVHFSTTTLNKSHPLNMVLFCPLNENSVLTSPSFVDIQTLTKFGVHKRTELQKYVKEKGKISDFLKK